MAEDLLHRRIDQDDQSPFVNGDDGVCGRTDNARQPGLALAQRRLGPLALPDLPLQDLIGLGEFRSPLLNPSFQGPAPK